MLEGKGKRPEDGKKGECKSGLMTHVCGVAARRRGSRSRKLTSQMYVVIIINLGGSVSRMTNARMK